MSPRRLLLIAAVALIAALVWWRSHRFDAAHQPRDASSPQVPLVAVRSGSAPVTLSAVGNVVSPHTVNVRAQLSGTLQKIYFREGDDVRAGQKLFLIEPAPYEAALAQARAQLAVDRAALSAARAQFERMKPLIDKEYVTSQEFDDARAAADEAAARVLADEAAVRSARINLGYTEIRAPIDGRTGSIGAKTGNLVSSGDAQPLVVINEIDPVQVRFALPQTQLADIQQALQRGDVPVSVLGDDADRPLATGKLDFIENAVDASTGTVTLKALIDNPDHRLWPGAFVNVRVQLAVDDHALLVPESAVQPGADGQYVFVVGADGKAMLRTISVDRQIGSELVVGSGLKAGEIIVAQIPHNLQPGTPVRALDASPGKARGGSPQ